MVGTNKEVMKSNMKVSVKDLINQLKNLADRLNDLSDKINELEEQDEETISLFELKRYLEWSDTLNISVACDAIEQAYLDEKGNEK